MKKLSGTDQHPAKKPPSSDPFVQARRGAGSRCLARKRLLEEGKPIPSELKKQRVGQKPMDTDSKDTEKGHLVYQRKKWKKEDPTKIFPKRFSVEEINRYNKEHPDAQLKFYTTWSTKQHTLVD